MLLLEPLPPEGVEEEPDPDEEDPLLVLLELLPLEYLNVLKNREIFSSNNAYAVTMTELGNEKRQNKKLFTNCTKHKLFLNCLNMVQSLNQNMKDTYMKCFTLEKDGILRIYRDRGLGGLFKGLNMRLLTVIPASAIMVTVYEFVKNFDV